MRGDVSKVKRPVCRRILNLCDPGLAGTIVAFYPLRLVKQVFFGLMDCSSLHYIGAFRPPAQHTGSLPDADLNSLHKTEVR